MSKAAAQHDTAKASPLGLVGLAAMCELLEVSRPTLTLIMREPDFLVFRLDRRKFSTVDGLRQWVEDKARGAA